MQANLYSSRDQRIKQAYDSEADKRWKAKHPCKPDQQFLAEVQISDRATVRFERRVLGLVQVWKPRFIPKEERTEQEQRRFEEARANAYEDLWRQAEYVYGIGDEKGEGM